MEIFGTLGPSCRDAATLVSMIREGMTGVRLNLSHTSLAESRGMITALHEAEQMTGKKQAFLIDLQGPEMRIGQLYEDVTLYDNEIAMIPVGRNLLPYLKPYQTILLDDGKLRGTILSIDEKSSLLSVRMATGGVLKSEKSLKIEGAETALPTLTGHDVEHIRTAKAYGVTAIMQPFVRTADDLMTVREVMEDEGATDLRLFAKIEDLEGVRHLHEILPLADMVVIARGDLGNNMPLYELPAVQHAIEERCRSVKKPYLIVTEMLSSMIKKELPTRAEVSDVFHAAYRGAAAVMVTGETAIGKYPVEVIRFLSKTAASGEAVRLKESGESAGG